MLMTITLLWTYNNKSERYLETNNYEVVCQLLQFEHFLSWIRHFILVTLLYVDKHSITAVKKSLFCVDFSDKKRIYLKVADDLSY